jgi:hypothetical protein
MYKRDYIQLRTVTETGLEVFNVTLVVVGRGTVLEATKADELSEIFPQISSINVDVLIIRLTLISPYL